MKLFHHTVIGSCCSLLLLLPNRGALGDVVVASSSSTLRGGRSSTNTLRELTTSQETHLTNSSIASYEDNNDPGTERSCCTINFRECFTAEWCNSGGAERCQDSCHGYWWTPPNQEQEQTSSTEEHCIARWEGGCGYTNVDVSSSSLCCEGLTCVQWSPSWIGCGLAGIDGPPATLTHSPTTALPSQAPSSVPTKAPTTPSPTIHASEFPTTSKSEEPTQSPSTQVSTKPTTEDTSITATTTWAFQESFDGTPTSPSQDLLPSNFEYVVTYRSHPGRHFQDDSYAPFLADHDDSCRGPDPTISPLRQHLVYSNQRSTGSQPDESFYICRDHMMSALGGAGQPYGLSAFWARQDFDFGSDSGSDGVLEFDVNINDDHGVRSWWEIVIAPRSQLKFAPGPVDSPISETYPIDRIVFDFRRNVRTIKVGTGALAPNGWIAHQTQRGPYDYAWWRNLHPDDPALDDHRIRRKMRITFADNNSRIVWGIEAPDGSMDEWSVDIPGGLPFKQGLVLFKTHAYNPEKDGNQNIYTFHWDNIRWNGPVTGLYDVYEASNVVYLQRDGPRPIGDAETVTIELPDPTSTLQNPALVGQIHHPMIGQVMLSINGGPNISVQPFDYGEPSEIFGPSNDGCSSRDWKSFRLPLDNSVLVQGSNTFKWTIAARPNCARSDEWDGFSVKFLHIQSDRF